MVWATEGFYLSFCHLIPKPPQKNGSSIVLSKGPNLKEMTG